MTTTDEAVALVDAYGEHARYFASTPIEGGNVAFARMEHARTALLSVLSAKDAEIERLTKERDEALKSEEAIRDKLGVVRAERDGLLRAVARFTGDA